MWPFNTKSAVPAEETKSESDISSPQEWFTAWFGGGDPGTLNASAATALQVPAVASAVRLIAEAVASLEIKVERKSSGGFHKDETHPAHKLLTGEANPWTSSFEMIRDLMSECLTSDPGGFAVVTRSSDKRPIEIIKYGAGVVMVEYKPDGSGEPKYTRNGKVIPLSDVIHIRNAFNKSSLSLARNAIAFAGGLEAYGRNLFKNGARPGGVLLSDKPLGDAGVVNMLKGWSQAFSGSENSGKTPVLWSGTTYEQLGLASTDAQYLENRKFQILEIARAFRVPPGMIFDLDRATWGNAEQMGREFLSYTLEPWLREVEGALSRTLLSDEERKTMRISFDRDDLTRASLTERATAISSFVQTKTLNANEARAWIDLPPRDGGDVYENPAITVNEGN